MANPPCYFCCHWITFIETKGFCIKNEKEDLSDCWSSGCGKFLNGSRSVVNPVFSNFTEYNNPIDKLFVYIVDSMPLYKWTDGASQWDFIMQIWENDVYNSGVELELDIENKRFRKISNETLNQRIQEQRKKQEYEKFISSIGRLADNDELQQEG